MGTLRNGCAAVLACLFGAGGVWADCAPDRLEMRGDFGAVAFTIDVADDARERAQGLMFVESMPRFTGMLFIYERPQPLSFWMRNTLIPLDMLFLTDAGEVYHIHENAVPLDETPIRAPGEGLAVLELNGGLSRQLGLRVGDVVRHPGLPQDAAAWPCAD